MDIRVRRARINVATTLVHQLVSILCGLLIPWIMIDTFGSVAYGATTSIAQFLSYITLFEGGIGRVARGALYKPLAEGDDENISRVYLAVRRFFRIIGLAFAGYAIILSLVYYDIADVTTFTREYIVMLVLSIAIGKFAEYMGGISKVTLLNADQKQYVVNTVYMMTNVLNVILIVALAKCGADILWVKLVSSGVFILRPLLYTLYIRRHYRIAKTGEKAVLPNKRTGIAQHTAYVVQNNTDVMILTVLADLRCVAVYSVYHLIVFSMRNIVSAFTSGMEAMLGNMVAKNEQDTLRRTYYTYKLLLTILTVVLFGTTALLIVPFVMLYTEGVTDAQYRQPLFALVLVLAEALNCLTLPCFNLTIAANKLKESRIGAYGEAAINVAVSLALVWWNPLVGVALGTLAATLFKSVYYMVFSARQVLQVPVYRLFLQFAAATLTLLLMSAAGVWIIHYVDVASYGMWILMGLGGVAITGAVGLSLGVFLYPDRMGGLKELLWKGGKKNA